MQRAKQGVVAALMAATTIAVAFGVSELRRQPPRTEITKSADSAQGSQKRKDVPTQNKNLNASLPDLEQLRRQGIEPAPMIPTSNEAIGRDREAYDEWLQRRGERRAVETRRWVQGLLRATRAASAENTSVQPGVP